MATALEWDWNVLLSPLIPGSAAGKGQEYLSLPHEGSHTARRRELSSRIPARSPPEPCRDPLSGQEPAWICLVLLRQQKRCFILALPSSFGPHARLEQPGSKHWHIGPTPVLLVGLPQVPRPAQPGPRGCSCPSSLELRLRHVVWVEGGGLASFKSKGRKHIHIWLRKRHVTGATAANTGKISPRACSSSSTCPQPTVISPKIPHGLLLLGYYTIDPHTNRGERQGVFPANPCPSPSSGE